jgi:hypothetical protein
MAAAVLALLAGCGARHAIPAPGAHRAQTPHAAPARPARRAPEHSMFGRAFRDPAVTVAGGGLYLSWALAPRGQPASLLALARVDPATGRIVAELSPGLFSVPLYAAGSLWVTDGASAGERLLRLDPRSLAVTGTLNVGEGYGHVAFAAGWIWVDGADRLLRVAPRSMRAEHAIPLPRADSSDVAASPDGRTLIVTAAREGVGLIQRRDPRTGALLASSSAMLGVAAPVIGDVTQAGTWVAEPTGMMGYVERFQTASLRPQAATFVEGNNSIRVSAWDGRLWVSAQAGGGARNYCADLATGRKLASLPASAWGQEGVLLAVGGRDFYYSYSTDAGVEFRVGAAPVPTACLPGR